MNQIILHYAELTKHYTKEKGKLRKNVTWEDSEAIVNKTKLSKLYVMCCLMKLHYLVIWPSGIKTAMRHISAYNIYLLPMRSTCTCIFTCRSSVIVCNYDINSISNVLRQVAIKTLFEVIMLIIRLCFNCARKVPTHAEDDDFLQKWVLHESEWLKATDRIPL